MLRKTRVFLSMATDEFGSIRSDIAPVTFDWWEFASRK